MNIRGAPKRTPLITIIGLKKGSAKITLTTDGKTKKGKKLKKVITVRLWL